MQANAQGGLAGASGRIFERVSVVKALAGRKVPSSVAHGFAPNGAELVVIEKYGAGLDAASLETIERDVRATMSLRHPNVAAVRDVWRDNDELCVATEYVEGETLEELRRLGTGGKELSIEVGVRIVVDLLGALSAIHTRGSGGLAHGEVTAANAIVGFDGVTRLVRPFRGHVAGKVAEAEWFAYAAPEVIRGQAADVRADLYAVGVLLWETLSRRKLFPKASRETRAARSMPVGKPQPPPDAGWAAPLGAVAERALSNDPAARYTTAAEMAAAVRLAVRSKLAMPPRVAAAVDRLSGEKIFARRNESKLDEASSVDGAARISVRPSRPPIPAEATRALAAMRPSSRPPTPNPGIVAPVIPKAAPVPALETKPAEPPRTGPRPAAPSLKLADAKPKPPLPAPQKIEPAPVAGPPKAAGAISDAAQPISIEDPFAEEEAPTKPLSSVPPAKPAFPAPTAKPIEEKPEAKPESAAAAPIVTPPPAATAVATPIATPEPTPAHVLAMPVLGVPSNEGMGRRAIVIAVALVALVAIGALVRIAMAPSTPTASPTSSAKGTVTAPATTTVAAITATPKPTATATTTAPASAETATEPDPATSAGATTPPPEGSIRRSRTKPRPTYDPMGI